MKILFVTDRYWPSIGGAEQYVRTLAHLMSANHLVEVICIIRDERDFITNVWFPDDTNHIQQDGDVIVHTLKIAGIRRLLSSVLLLEPLLNKLFKKYFYTIRAYAIKYSAILLAPSVSTLLQDTDIIHSIAPWELSHAVNQIKTRKQPHIITGLLHSGFWADDIYSLKHFQRCNHIIALTQNEKNQYVELGFDQNDISVIGVPINLNMGIASVATVTKIQHPYILFLGVKRPYKGIRILLQAAKMIWKELPNICLVLAGPSTDYSNHLLKDWEHDDRVHVFDRISEEEKWSLISECELVCLPSQTEIMPNIILEAWSLKKPVVTSAIPNLVELVDKCGVTVQQHPEMLANAILSILKNPSFAQELGKLGQKKCEKEFSSQYIINKMVSVYKQVCS